jgi:hypothetical protein
MRESYSDILTPSFVKEFFISHCFGSKNRFKMTSITAFEEL